MSRARGPSARVAGLVLLVATGCDPVAPELALSIRVPAERDPRSGVAALTLRVERDGRVLAQSSVGPDASHIGVGGVPYGPRTIVRLDGVTAAGDVIARGQTCPVDFDAPGAQAALYFAPTNSFSATLAAPGVARASPALVPLGTGDVLVVGGSAEGKALDTGERYRTTSSTFHPFGAALSRPRADAELARLTGIGAILIGGLGADGLPVGGAELYRDEVSAFERLESDRLPPRRDQRAIALDDGRTLLTGGRAAGADAPDASTLFISVGTDGSTQLAPGPMLLRPREAHTVVIAAGVALAVGGRGVDGAPLQQIEALIEDASGPRWLDVAALRFGRVGASATALADGSVLIVGGADASGKPRGDAELFNPVTDETRLLSLAVARQGHTATLLPSGRVLILGGTGADGTALSSVELFVPRVGFVTGRPLGAARAGHRAIALCDGTVLVVGGAATAELYTPPAG